MKIPKSTIHFLLVLEAIALVVVLLLCVVHPVASLKEGDVATNTGNANENGENGINTENVQDIENAIGTVVTPPEPVFSEEILAKVASMTLEQKVAQMFLTTPEALTDTDRVTLTGNTTRNAINQYPVGGLIYSSINFQGKTQTASMVNGVQDHCLTQLGMPMFLMVGECGGQANSPLATINRYNVEAAASEIGATGDAQKAIDAATNISTYLKQEGFNMNLAPNADLAAGKDEAYDNNTYSADASVAAIMVAETVSTYDEQGILTVMSMFPGESTGNTMKETKANWEEAEGLVYKAGMDAGVDAIMVGDVYAPAFTGNATTPCCMSKTVVNYLRGNMQYTGVLISDSISEENIAAGYTVTQAAVAAINAGMDMVYCPTNFKEAYQGVLAAVTNRQVSQDVIDEAVARILTCKQTLEVQ